MKLEHLDTTKMLFNPKSKTFLKDITSTIEEYKSYRPRKVDKEKIFKFICLMYDRKTPVSLEIAGYYQKKAEVGAMVGFEQDDDGYFVEDYENILYGKDNKVNMFIALYLSKQGLPEFTQKIVYMEMLMHESIKGLQGKSNKDTFANMEKLNVRLKELNRFLFQSNDVDEVLEVRNALYAQLERDKILIRPEAIVKVKEEMGELPKEFDQYPDEGGKRKVPLGEEDMHFYNETEQERTERKEYEKGLTK